MSPKPSEHPTPKPKRPDVALPPHMQQRITGKHPAHDKRPLFARRPEPQEHPLMGRLPDEMRRKKIRPPR